MPFSCKNSVIYRANECHFPCKPTPIEGYFLAYQRIITSIGPARHRSLFVGLFGSAVGLVSGSVNYLAGALYARHGFRAPMALATLGCAVGFVLALVLVSMLRQSRRLESFQTGPASPSTVQ